MAVPYSWHFAPFLSLSADQLHRILSLRAEVFVLEQNCAYVDPDAKDRGCHHLWAEDAQGQVAAVARLLAPGASYAQPSIGRVATSSSVRGTGLGRELMKRVLLEAERLYPGKELVISAQCYLEGFYTDFAFVPRASPTKKTGFRTFKCEGPADSKRRS